MNGELFTGIFIALSLLVAILLARAGSRRLQMQILVAYIAVGLLYAAFMGGLLT